MRKIEISPRIYVDMMGYPRDIVIAKLGGGARCVFPNVVVVELGGGLSYVP